VPVPFPVADSVVVEIPGSQHVSPQHAPLHDTPWPVLHVFWVQTFQPGVIQPLPGTHAVPAEQQSGTNAPGHTSHNVVEAEQVKPSVCLIDVASEGSGISRTAPEIAAPKTVGLSLRDITAACAAATTAARPMASAAILVIILVP
jgi:hypothetical protein